MNKSPPLPTLPLFSNHSMLATCSSRMDYPRIVAKVFWCKRFGKRIFSTRIHPSSDAVWKWLSNQDRFGCAFCEDKKFCVNDKKDLEITVISKKPLKHGIILYDETGITQETRIGRFVFKLKGTEDGNTENKDPQKQ